MDGRTAVLRVAEVLHELNADFIALQEVWYDQAQMLARAIGYEFAFAPARRHRGFPYGNASLSRASLEASRNIDLTAGREPRLALRSDLDLGGWKLHIFNVHLGTAWSERRRQAALLLSEELLRAGDLSAPRVILGDFNEWTTGRVTRALRAEFPHARQPRRSFPGLLPVLALDALYYDRPLQQLRLYHHRTRRALLASDHLPLVGEFETAR